MSHEVGKGDVLRNEGWKIEGWRNEGWRITRLVSGLFFFALGIVLTLHANLGYSPWEVFHQGIALNLGLTMGMSNNLVASAVILFDIFMGEAIGIGGILNVILIGVFVDILMLGGWVPVMEGFPEGVVMMVSGLFVIAAATVLYIGAGYGAGPRDSLMVALSRRTGKSPGLCRGVLEGAILLAGWLLGGYAGIGTLISALGIGVTVQAVFAILRFDVKAVHQESLRETAARIKMARTKTADEDR
jgi:uncharacterized membrane protein YczE